MKCFKTTNVISLHSICGIYCNMKINEYDYVKIILRLYENIGEIVPDIAIPFL